MAATETTGGSLKLAALTAAALALPGMTPETQALGIDDSRIETGFSRYEESGNRMRIDVYQAALMAPLNDHWSLMANGVKDVVSGASPVAVGLDRNGKRALIMSRASIRDVRDEVDLKASYSHGNAVYSVDAGRSSENDYASNFFNVDGRWDLNQKQTTLAAGFGYSSDLVWANLDISPTDAGREPGIGGDKQSYQGMLGLTQVIDKNSLFQVNLTYNNSQGYLSDPYKFALARFRAPAGEYFGNLGYLRDNRPGQREQFGVLLRYVRHFSELNSAALHLDYRFYADTWGIDAHTFEASWYQPLFDGWQLAPRVRYYSQIAADFYQPVYQKARADGYYSTDYRMAGFGAVSGGVQLSKEFFDRLRLAASFDFYQRRKELELGTDPGTRLDNFSFSMFTVHVDWKF